MPRKSNTRAASGAGSIRQRRTDGGRPASLWVQTQGPESQFAAVYTGIHKRRCGKR